MSLAVAASGTAAQGSTLTGKPPCTRRLRWLTGVSARTCRWPLAARAKPGRRRAGSAGGFAVSWRGGQAKSSQWLARSTGQARQFTERLAALAPVVQPGPAGRAAGAQAPLLLRKPNLGPAASVVGSALSTARRASSTGSRRRRPGDAARTPQRARPPQRPWISRSRPRSNRNAGVAALR